MKQKLTLNLDEQKTYTVEDTETQITITNECPEGITHITTLDKQGWVLDLQTTIAKALLAETGGDMTIEEYGLGKKHAELLKHTFDESSIIRLEQQVDMALANYTHGHQAGYLLAKEDMENGLTQTPGRMTREEWITDLEEGAGLTDEEARMVIDRYNANHNYDEQYQMNVDWIAENAHSETIDKMVDYYLGMADFQEDEEKDEMTQRMKDLIDRLVETYNNYQTDPGAMYFHKEALMGELDEEGWINPANSTAQEIENFIDEYAYDEWWVKKAEVAGWTEDWETKASDEGWINPTDEDEIRKRAHKDYGMIDPDNEEQVSEAGLIAWNEDDIKEKITEKLTDLLYNGFRTQSIAQEIAETITDNLDMEI